MFVLVDRQARDAGRINSLGRRAAGSKLDARIFKSDAVVRHAEAERNVRTGVVHVVALNAFVHDAEAATNNGLAIDQSGRKQSQGADRRLPSDC